MSRENVETVRRWYAAVNERDYSAFSELAHPDFVLDVSRNVFNPGVHHGVDGLREFAEQTHAIWGDFRIDYDELIDAGDQVVAAIRISGRGRGSGAEAEMRLFNVWTLRDGRISRCVGGYRDRAEALEAAGLSE